MKHFSRSLMDVIFCFANMIMHWHPFIVLLVMSFIHRSFKGISVQFFPSKPFSWKQYVDAALSQSNFWKLTKNSYNLLLDLLQGKIYIFTCKLATSLQYFCWKHNVNKLPFPTFAVQLNQHFKSFKAFSFFKLVILLQPCLKKLQPLFEKASTMFPKSCNHIFKKIQPCFLKASTMLFKSLKHVHYKHGSSCGTTTIEYYFTKKLRSWHHHNSKTNILHFETTHVVICCNPKTQTFTTSQHNFLS